MSQETRIFRSVEATGEAAAKYDLATFSVTVSQKGKTGPEAKAKAKPIVQAIKAAIDQLKADGAAIPEQKFRLMFEVVPNLAYIGGEQQFKGYLANYAISFSTPTVEKASEIMDKLTSIPETTVNAPLFTVNDPGSLYREALQDAFKKAISTFRTECEVLGLELERFGLASWHAQPGDGHRRGGKGGMMAMAAMAGTAESAPTEIEAGQAKYSVSLALNFCDAEEFGCCDLKNLLVPAGETVQE